jgi:uncharacterized protein (TIGR02145 family)
LKAFTNQIDETLVNLTTEPITVTYKISLSTSGCENVQDVKVVINPTPVTPVILSDPFPAYQGMPIDLTSTLNPKNPAYTYTFYDDNGFVVGPVITFMPPKTKYYVKASIGNCETDLVLINLKDPCPATILDIDNIEYNVTSLGGYCWTDNLKTTTSPSTGEAIPFANAYQCPTCPAQLDTIFGLLYTWYSATCTEVGSTDPITGTIQGICPEGYHLPCQAEWAALEKYPASQLKSTQYWLNPPGPGTDTYGWNALPSGWFNSALNRYQDLYGFAGWWASDAPAGSTATHSSLFYYCDDVKQEVKEKSDGLSVRCVMNY